MWIGDFNVITLPKVLEIVSLLHPIFLGVSSACARVFTVHQMLENTRGDHQIIQMTLYHDL